MNYQPENFDAHNAYAHHYAVSPARACEAGRRALLSQGFVVDTADAKQVSGHKYFQPDSNHNVQLTFHVVCAAQGKDAGGGTIVFASGLQDQYTLRKTKESASVGVGMLGSLSLPFAGSTDALVKVASATINDNALYESFFDLVNKLLQSGQVPQTLPPSAPASSPAAAASAAKATPAAVAEQITPSASAVAPAAANLASSAPAPASAPTGERGAPSAATPASAP